jgi:hypothetical protein
MGYHSRTHGAITITPPLTWDEYKNSPFRDNRHNEYRDVILHMERATWTRDAPEPPQEGGPEIVATELRGHEDEYKCYHMEEHLNEFIAAFPGRAYDGHLIRIGEGQGDLERYTIENEELIVEKARLVWSDGPIENIEDVEDEHCGR